MLLWGLTVPVVLRYQVDCLTQKPGSRCGGPRLTSDSGVPAGMATHPYPGRREIQCLHGGLSHTFQTCFWKDPV